MPKKNFNHEIEWHQKSQEITMNWEEFLLCGRSVRPLWSNVFSITQFHPMRQPRAIMTFPSPLPMIRHNQARENLTGTKFGAFTVLGLFTIQDKEKTRFNKTRVYRTEKWQVQCRCGNCEIREPKQLRNSQLDVLMCSVCREVYRMYAFDFKRSKGMFPDEMSNDITQMVIDYMFFAMEEEAKLKEFSNLPTQE